jgi:hypothetical protein
VDHHRVLLPVVLGVGEQPRAAAEPGDDEATVANIAIPISGNGSDTTSERALAALRSDIVQPTVGSIAGSEAGVTGFTVMLMTVSCGYSGF